MSCGVGEDSWGSLGLQDQTSQSQSKTVLNIHRKDWCRSWSSNTSATWCKELTHWKRPWCWEILKAEEGDDRGWDGWMASLTQWTWVWASSRSWWWTGKCGVLQSIGLQRVRYDWATELKQGHHHTSLCPNKVQKLQLRISIHQVIMPYKYWKLSYSKLKHVSSLCTLLFFFLKVSFCDLKPLISSYLIYGFLFFACIHWWDSYLATAVSNMVFPGDASVKEPAWQCRRHKSHGFDPWVGKDSLEEKMAIHSSILAWRIPWTEEPCGLRSIGWQRIEHDWSNLAWTNIVKWIKISSILRG